MWGGGGAGHCLGGGVEPASDTTALKLWVEGDHGGGGGHPWPN
jgi:hypothetical protein